MAHFIHFNLVGTLTKFVKIGKHCMQAERFSIIQLITMSTGLTLSGLSLHCHLHPLQAVNCCRNSRLVVEEDDLMWVKKCRKLPYIGKPVSWKYVLQNL